VAAHDQAPHVPIVVMTGLQDENLAVRAVKSGAQDYLVKGHSDGHELGMSLRYAVERFRLEEARRGSKPSRHRRRAFSCKSPRSSYRGSPPSKRHLRLDSGKRLAQPAAVLAAPEAAQPAFRRASALALPATELRSLWA